MYYHEQALHHLCLFLGGVGVVAGFLFMMFLDTTLGFWTVMAGLILMLGGVATVFAKDKNGKERLVDDLVRESETLHQKKGI